MGVAQDQLPAVLTQLQQLAATPGLSAGANSLLSGLSGFLAQVDEAYAQNDRDLELKARSLELSSVELTQSNERLREELDSRTRAINSLRETAINLSQNMSIDMPVFQDDSLVSLSRLMAELVHQREIGQHELKIALSDLAKQKFALGGCRT
ncbi:MAG: hypothetical protein CO065_03600 [Comamonadaceae bacterium CG_4_9_14_0_8_um_filter_57_21]|nr:MAG: hypothetical protein CO065_03600 [Comamonadaceae bacterium CG_4_9_14_0_8_um_filter_57_21]